MATLLITAALLLPCASGWLMLRARHSPAACWPETLCELCLGGALGLGLSSCTYYLWLVTVGHASPWYFAFEGPVMLLGIVWSWRKAGGGLKLLPPFALPTQPRLRLMFATAALTTTGILVFLSMHIWWEPWSHDDAVSMWGLKARMMFLGGDRWNQLFADPMSGDEYVVSPDYPLLLPSAIVRCWSACGRPHRAAPALLAVTFWALTIGLCGGLVARLRKAEYGWLAALTLLGTVFQAKMVTGQCADVPLSCYILATFACIALNENRASPRAWILPGLFAGLAAWTKNEGLVFACALLAAETGTRLLRAGMRDTARVLIGFGPALAVILAVVFSAKILVVPFNAMMKQQGASTIERLVSPERYFLIARSMVVETWLLAGWHLLVFAGLWHAAGRPWRGLFRSRQLNIVVTLVLMLGAFCGFYLVTPFQLEWHLASSLRRLLLQIWPAWVALFWLWYGGLSGDRGPSEAAPHWHARGWLFGRRRSAISLDSRGIQA